MPESTDPTFDPERSPIPRTDEAASVQRWAAIGTGAISRIVIPDLQACPGAQVAVVQSRDFQRAAQFAEDFGIPAWTDDYDTVLADESINVVYIATPIGTHHALARAALLAGKHVLVEKPISMTAEQATDLFEVASAQGRFLMEAMWTKFNPAFRHMMQEINGGLIGQPRSVRAGFCVPWPEDDSNRWKPELGGGALLDQGVYPVMLAHTLFGTPAKVHAVGSVRSDGLDLESHVTLEYADGAFAHLTTGMTQFSDCSAAVAGDLGWVTLPAPFWATTDLELHAGEPQFFFGSGNRIELEQEGNGYVPMLRDVIDAVSRGATEHPLHTAADTIQVLATIDAIRGQLRNAY